EGSITTLDENIPLGNGNTYYVATNGSDSTGSGSIGSSWRTVQYG
ncbi:hypothetical protein LCGC14_2776200, partial [marine sediment metagenome]